MKKILHDHIKVELCNQSAFDAYNSAVITGVLDPGDKMPKKIKNNAIVLGEINNIKNYKQANLFVQKHDPGNANLEMALNGYRNAKEAYESWRDKKGISKEERKKQSNYFMTLKNDKLKEIRRHIKLKDL